MAPSLARAGSCVLLAALSGCLVDRSALTPGVMPDPVDAHVADEDAGAIEDEDAGAIEDDATGMGGACGDGALDAGEACDDGNADAGDGCDPSCAIESGFACAGEPSVCVEACGDGRVEAPETCDDGNVMADDGCSPSCLVEAGYACSGAPSACNTTCGDGTAAGREECDDGGLFEGDGCDASCRYETSRRVVRGPGLALGIADNAYDGSLGTMSCVDFDVRPFPLDTVTSVEAELAMRHPWVADLVIKLVGPGGAPVVTLMSRPSLDETADNGMGRNGNYANLDPAFPVRFVSGAPASAEDMGDGIDDGTVCAADGVCAFAPDAGAATPGDLSLFVGGPASGEWRFCVGDGAGADVGEIDAVTLVMGLAR